MKVVDQQVIRAQTFSFLSSPRHHDHIGDCYCYHEDGALVVDAYGRIKWHGAFIDLPAEYAYWRQLDLRPFLIMPGFIDAHVHYPQYRMMGAPANDVLEWLNRYTFAEEMRFCDENIAKTAAEQFLQRLFDHGTTSALVFAASQYIAAESLFAVAEAYQMAILSSNILMDQNAPDGLCVKAREGADDTIKLISRWHQKNRSQIAITLRFAITSSEAQLALSGDLLKDYPDCLFQTHLAESKAEIAMVKKLFPWSKDYCDVYDHFGLIGKQSIFAHGIHLSDREQALLSEKQSALIHCPSSNNFLGSGLFNVDRWYQKPSVSVGLASDIAGGTHYSMLVNMAEAYKVARLKNCAFDVWDGFYMATLGNAKILKLEKEIGSLSVGKWADLVVLDLKATPVLAARHCLSKNVEDKLFALMMLGDDRAVRSTMIAGHWVKKHG
ncbi:MAG: guanine deaminase [Pseudomonadota bacterium]